MLTSINMDTNNWGCGEAPISVHGLHDIRSKIRNDGLVRMTSDASRTGGEPVVAPTKYGDLSIRNSSLPAGQLAADESIRGHTPGDASRRVTEVEFVEAAK